MGAMEYKDALWINQYFLFSFVCEEGRQTSRRTISSNKLDEPLVLDERYGFTFDMFIRHIETQPGDIRDIPNDRRHHIFQWRGEKHTPILDDDSSFSDDMFSEESDES